MKSSHIRVQYKFVSLIVTHCTHLFLMKKFIYSCLPQTEFLQRKITFSVHFKYELIPNDILSEALIKCLITY